MSDLRKKTKTGTPASRMRPEDIEPCPGSGQPWHLAARHPICPACDAGPATLRVPDPEPHPPGNDTQLVPSHPNMVVWAGRIDVVQWRTIRAAMRGSEEAEL